MDGFTATQLIRTLPGYGRVPIIALTAAVGAEDRKRCAEVGMEGFLGKPFLAAELVQVLKATGLLVP